MVAIVQIDAGSRQAVDRFVRFPYTLYDGHPQWVPPLWVDARLFLNRKKHPYYEHSDADFFIAEQEGKVVGRIAALENRSYNRYHGKQQAQFYLFDTIEDSAVVKALFERVFEWARARGLKQVVGPKGFGALDGYGIQIEGFEHRQMMTMMNYNYPYYQELVERQGFRKEVDFISCYASRVGFVLPERIHSIAERVQRRGTLRVKTFRNKRELVSWGVRIGHAYNKAFVNNWEYSPFSDRELKFVIDNIMVIADHRLIKIIMHDDEVVGFLFAFPDVSAALQRVRGRLFPTGLFDILREVRRTNWVAVNGAGVLPEFQGRGGNALLYSEMEKTMHDFDYTHADLTQVAETAVLMRADLANLGGVPYKNHRVFIKDI